MHHVKNPTSPVTQHFFLSLTNFSRLILKSLSLCFINDQNDFVDVFKFDHLREPLCKQLELFNLEEHTDFVGYSKMHLIPCIIKLFDLVGDDYKWKSLQHTVREFL